MNKLVIVLFRVGAKLSPFIGKQTVRLTKSKFSLGFNCCSDSAISWNIFYGSRLSKNLRTRQVKYIKRYEKQFTGHHVQVDVEILTFRDKSGNNSKKVYLSYSLIFGIRS